MEAAKSVRPPTNTQITIEVVSCAGLKGVEKHGTSSDPYVKVRGHGSEHWEKTQHISKNLNPVFNHPCKFYDAATKYDIEVWDHNKILHDKLICSCTLDLEDPQLQAKGFPEDAQAVEITKEFAETGSITLKITPEGWGSMEKRNLREAASWPEHSFSTPVGSVSWQIKLPYYLAQQQIANDPSCPWSVYAHFTNAVKYWSDRDNQLQFMASEGVETVTNKRDLQAVADNRIIMFPKVGKIAKYTGQRGETTLLGKDVIWLKFYVDFTPLDSEHPWCAIETVYIFELGGVAQHFHFFTMKSCPSGGKPAPSMEQALEAAEATDKEFWAAVRNTIQLK